MKLAEDSKMIDCDTLNWANLVNDAVFVWAVGSRLSTVLVALENFPIGGDTINRLVSIANDAAALGVGAHGLGLAIGRLDRDHPEVWNNYSQLINRQRFQESGYSSIRL